MQLTFVPHIIFLLFFMYKFLSVWIYAHVCACTNTDMCVYTYMYKVLLGKDLPK